MRAAGRTGDVEAAMGPLRVAIFVGAGIGVLLALFMSGLAAHLMARTVRDLVDKARAVAAGERAGRLSVHTGDELGGLAGSFNRLADALEGVVSTLAAERDRFQAVLESMREAVIALDAGCQATLVNRTAVDWLRLRGEAVGRTLLELARVPGLQQLADRALDGQTASAELDLPGRPAPRRVLAHAAPLSSGRGCILVLYDVTEIRRLERIRRDFVANVSHELRTPVSIVRANAETLLDGALDDPGSARRFVDGIHRNAERLTRLIGGLLDISRLEAGKYAIAPVAIDLRRAALRTASALGSLAEDKHIQVAIDVPADLRAMADPQALDQILTNLVANALKYTPAGGHVVIAAHRAAPADAPDAAPLVRIDVVDDGPGLDPRHRPRIFERFYRVDDGRARAGGASHETGGTGLGLAIVKHLAEAMDGEVGVEAVTPHGSRFWVALPSAPVTDLHAPVTDAALSPPFS